MVHLIRTLGGLYASRLCGAGLVTSSPLSLLERERDVLYWSVKLRERTYVSVKYFIVKESI